MGCPKQTQRPTLTPVPAPPRLPCAAPPSVAIGLAMADTQNALNAVRRHLAEALESNETGSGFDSPAEQQQAIRQALVRALRSLESAQGNAEEAAHEVRARGLAQWP